MIRPDLDPTHVFASTREEEMYSYPLGGPFFRDDNKAVFRLLSDLVKDQSATWIQPFQASQDGRRAWQALVTHFDGGGQKEKRISRAEATIESLTYNNERVFSFDSYSAKLLKAFRTLDDTPSQRTPAHQVRVLLEKIKFTTPEFAVIKSHVRANYRSDLQGAITYISREVSEIFPAVVPGQRNQARHRFVSEAASQQPPQSRNRSFSGLEQNNGIYTFYGVDVTDVTRWFTSQEMRMLGASGQAYIYQERDRLQGGGVGGGRGTRGGRGFGGRGRGGRGGGGGRGIGEIHTNDQSVITDITNDQGEQRSTATGTETGANDRGSNNGRRFGGGAYQGTGGGSESNGDRRRVSVVKCGPQRRVVGKMEKVWLSHENGDKEMGRNEMDTMADTCCAGKNWTLLETTGMECSVNDFAGNQVGKSSVPVATCATVVREPGSGVEVVVIGHQMLWFGEKLDKSLLNQNQIRHAGHVVRDDPTMKSNGFGIWADGLHIPFEVQGTTVFFESRAPDRHEIETLPSVTITRQELWDPHHVNITSPQSSPYQEAYGDTDAKIGLVSSLLAPSGIVRKLTAVPVPRVRQVATDRHSEVTPELLSRKWKIGLDTARATLRVTTQRGIRTAVAPITRRYRVDNLALHRNRLQGRFFTDTLFSKTLSLSGNKCAQVFTDGQFSTVYPLESKAHVGRALARFIDKVGVPESLTADLAGEQAGSSTLFNKLVRFHRVDMRWSEKGTGKQNHKAEREIGLLKQRWHRRMADSNVPRRLWDFGLVYETGLLSRIARGPDGRSGVERITGNTPDISEWVDFAFYDLVWYHNNDKVDATDEQVHLGRWLGIAHRIGSDLCYWILTKSGKVVARTTVQHVTKDDLSKPEIVEKVKQFELIVANRLDERDFTDNNSGGPGYLEDVYIEEEKRGRAGVVPTDEEYGNMIQEEIPEVDDNEPEYDEYVGTQVQIDVGGEALIGTVEKRQKGLDGKPTGRKHHNPKFDTRTYSVKFPGGVVHEFTANVIAKNMFSRMDDEGKRHFVVSEIVGHRRSGDAVSTEDGFYLSSNGNKHSRKTTKGWEIAVELRDGTQMWLPLKDVKNGYPMELAEYAVAQGIEQEPAFHWWVPATLNHMRRILKKVKKKYWRTTHKYGIKLPHSVEEALKIDRITSTTYWKDAIEKELRVVKVAWESREDLDLGEVRAGRQLIGHTEITCHMVFDVKMDLTRKARLVAGGHLTDAPSSLTYSSVVSRDSIRIAFLLASLNNLKVLACDIGNAYLNAPCREKIWFLGGPDVGTEYQGKVCVMVRALYGLKSSGASWRATLMATLYEMGFEDTKADPCVLRRKAKKDSGEEYYEVILVYVDDILLVSHNPQPVLDEINKHYKIKAGSIGEPSTYLGAQIYKHNLPDGNWAWGMSSEKYVTNAVKIVEGLLQEDGDGHHLKTTARVPVPTSYKPELDTSPELDADLTA